MYPICIFSYPKSTFFRVRLELVPYANDSGHHSVVRAEELFAFDCLEVKPEYAQDIKNCQSTVADPEGFH